MLFRVLGPLSVEGAGPALSALMVRRLLAALLCRPNECVAVEDLLLALWGQSAPAGSRKTLQVYVRRLRSALGEPRILHEPAGYRIVVKPGELDSAEFARLVAAAHDADPDQASAHLSGALKLWRSNAFEDVRDHPPIADEARRLDEELIRVEAWHARIQLERGRHAELVPHLTKLIEVHPYREDLRGHLMLALYRSGRQKEALEVFRDTRRLLDEELGVEPGPDLQRLHEAILRADPTLDLPTRPIATVPHELPSDIGTFVGREPYLNALNEMLPHPSTPVVISAIAGSAGVGKTALAVHWAHSVAKEFPDGQLYANLRGFDPAGPPATPAAVIRRFLDALGVPSQRIPSDPEAQAALYRSQLSDKRVLVLLDNARDAEQVRPLLPGSVGSLVVVTSRNRLSSLVATSSARPLVLDVLTELEAHQLLAARLGSKRLAAEPAAVDEIIARCARLPLALAIAASRAATQPTLPLEALAAQLRDESAFDSDDPLTDLKRVFSWSYQQLTDDAARLFRLLGLHPGPDTTALAAASLANLPIHQIHRLLSELLQAHLLGEHTTGRFTFHDLLRAYAKELVVVNDGVSQQRIATRRLLDHYVHTAHSASTLLTPSRISIDVNPPQPGVRPEALATHEEAMAWFSSEHEVLLAAAQLAASANFDLHVWQLAWSLSTFFDWQGHWRDQAEVQGAALDAALRSGDPHQQATAHRTLARAHHCLGDYDAAHAHLNEALTLYQEIGDYSGLANTHMALGMVYEYTGNYIADLNEVRKAFELFEIVGPPTASARALNAIGWCHALLGQYEKSVSFCSKALSRLQELGDRYGEACTWDSLGYAHHHLGDHGQALACYQRSVAVLHELGDRYTGATILTHLGEAHFAVGNHESARDSWHEALVVFNELSHPDAAKVLAKLGRLDQATSENINKNTAL